MKTSAAQSSTLPTSPVEKSQRHLTLPLRDSYGLTDMAYFHSFLVSLQGIIELPHGDITVPFQLARFAVCQMVVSNQRWLPV